MAGRLDGKTALVTGAASGIGRATASRFASEGAKVIVADINFDGVTRVANEIGPDALAMQLDVSSETQWKEATDAAISHFGRLDILANIAGVSSTGTIEEIEAPDWQRMLDVNLTGVMWGCKHGIRAIRASGGSGAIVNVSSIGGLIGAADLAAYCASKGGVTVLTKAVALHLAAARLPIRCVSIHPTYVDSEMLDPMASSFASRQDMIDGMSRLVPIGRVAKPSDVADAILFAASDEAAMITGSALILDGGQLAGPPSAHT